MRVTTVHPGAPLGEHGRAPSLRAEACRRARRLRRGAGPFALNVSKARAADDDPPPTTAATATTTATTTTAPSNGNDYTGMRLRDAVTKIADGRQQTVVQYVTSAKPAGVVIANSGTGARVLLQVSLGTRPKPARDVPDTTSRDASTAQRDLAAAGFAVIQVPWPVSDSAQDGAVVYETPTGRIAQGAAIVIYVGSATGG